MAMLGLIHRAVLQQGPAHFNSFFAPVQTESYSHLTRYVGRRHFKQLVSWRVGRFSEVLRRSALGLVSVYNLLPEDTVQQKTVKDFMRRLQEVLKERAAEGCKDWKNTYSPRVPLWKHPLR